MTNPPLHVDVIEFLDDRSLLEEYERTDRKLGTRVVDDLLAEIARRNLDI
jgi:hypothetical protein